jgi:hypothetical protein
MAEHAGARHLEALMKLAEDLPARLGILIQHGHTDSCTSRFNCRRQSSRPCSEYDEFQFFQLTSPARF